MIRPSIVSLGEVLWDLYPEGKRFGGAPANFACHAANHGADVAMVSAVGDDELGRKSLLMLERYGIDISLVDTLSKQPTGTVKVEIDAAGKPTFSIHENSAWDRIKWSADLSSQINSADAIYFGTLGQRSECSRNTIRRAIEAGGAAKVPRFLDINLRAPFFDPQMIRESIELADIVKLSDEELARVCSAFDISTGEDKKQMLQAILEVSNLEMIVMTLGADGAILVTPDVTLNQNGIPVNVADTVGAGDAFSAAFLLGLLRNQPNELSLRSACKVAAAACAHHGAVPERVSPEVGT